MKRKKQSDPLGVKVANMLEVPPNVFLSDGRLEFSGNREVLIDGYRGMQEYTEDTVKINMGKISVKFSGRGLSITSMTGDRLVIQGFIVNMEFIT